MGQSPSKPVIVGSAALGIAGLLAFLTLRRSKVDDGSKGGLAEFYNVDAEKIGVGTYGFVSKCARKSTGELRAVKSLSKERRKDICLFKQEIASLKIMDHPNIIKLYETYEDHRSMYLVMEICSGGNLIEKVGTMDVFAEAHAAIVMEQILRGVSHIHEMGITNFLIQPEHCLFQTKDPIESNTLKIIDFVFSRKLTEGTDLALPKCGTPFYVAPEVLLGKSAYVRQSADMWSCGVIMFILICGYPPFCGPTEADTLHKVKLGNFTMFKVDWTDCSVSDNAKALTRALLKLNRRDRYSAEQALNHSWIKNKAQNNTNPLNTVKNLKNFHSCGEGSRTQYDLKLS